MNSLNQKIGLLAAAALSLSLNVSAQKLPSEQKESVYAPDKVQIDGKPTEWAGKFQARNSATLLTYVMANDAENLYLTIQADQTPALGKIFYGGISLVIKSHTDKKAIPVKMTYPLVNLVQRTGIVIPLRDKKNNTDSVVIAVNNALGQAAKVIAVSGIAGIAEPDVSVYNEFGLKACVQVDHTRTMTFEYKLPLKYIKHLLDEAASFDYSIVVNGDKLEPGTVVVGGVSTSGGAMSINVSPIGDIFSPTDLKATYTLAKK